LGKAGKLVHAAVDAPRKARNLARLLGVGGAVKFGMSRAAGWPRAFWIRPRGCSRRLLLRGRGPDIFVVRAVFAQDECRVDLDPAPRVVVDAGAFCGYTAVYFAERWPGARVIAVEPAASNFEVLKTNCAGLEGVELLNAALWSGPATVRIEDPGAASWGFKVRPAAGGGVPAVSIPMLMERFGLERIDLLKVDIEGAETEVFGNGAREWIARVGCIVVELHGPECERAVRGAIAGQGFKEEWHGEKLVLRR
jgi:FkbM family methyltransferase